MIDKKRVPFDNSFELRKRLFSSELNYVLQLSLGELNDLDVSTTVLDTAEFYKFGVIDCVAGTGDEMNKWCSSASGTNVVERSCIDSANGLEGYFHIMHTMLLVQNTEAREVCCKTSEHRAIQEHYPSIWSNSLPFTVSLHNRGIQGFHLHIF